MRRGWFAVMGAVLFSAGASVSAEGNRYDIERHYKSDVSASEAFLRTHYGRGNDAAGAHVNAVIIDVRTVEEYVGGHPEGAYNIPYPHIQSRPDNADYIGQSAEQFVADVESAIPDKTTPIMTLCRSGKRSVLAANLLAEAGYTNVQNIWQGFEGKPKTDVNGNVLDLNNDGLITKEDQDGWSGYHHLPYSQKLTPNRIYLRYVSLYFD